MEQNIKLSKHIELLKKIPQKFFILYPVILNTVLNCETKRLNRADIARLYYDLGSNMINERQERKIYPTTSFDCYKYFDNIERNYYYVYNQSGHMPHLYRGVLTNHNPLGANIIITPKSEHKYNTVNEARKKFIAATRISDITTFGYYINPVPEDFLDNCYHALVELLECANLELAQPRRDKGSQILEDELINVFANQNILLKNLALIKYAPNERKEIMRKIKKHKKEMFGELQR